MHKLAVVIEPGFTDESLIKEALNKYRSKYKDKLFINVPIKGHSAVLTHCQEHLIPYYLFEANFNKHGRAAIQKRNSFMVYCSDGVLLFRNEGDRYQRMVRFAEHRGLSTQVVMQNESYPNRDYVGLLHKSGVKT